MQPALEVQCLRSLEEAAPLEGELDALNLASRRPSPYNALRYLRAFTAHDDLDRSEYQVLFLVGRQDGRLVGYLPLRRRRERVGPLSFRRVESLCTHDTDRPQVVARREDEARCAEAFRRHLLQVERGFSLLEFRQQDAESPLLTPEGLHDGVWVRWFPSWTNSTIPLPAGLDAWWKARSANYRSSVGRNVRRLLASGRAEYVCCRDPRATPRLLDLYFAMEAASWKAHSRIAVGQKPRRVALYRSLCDPALGCAPAFHLVLLDGRLIAALFSLELQGVTYWHELAYVEGAENLGPGNLLLLMALRDAMGRGLGAVNFLLGLAYYKERWGAVVTPTWLAQNLRVGSLPFWKALAGSLRRRVAPRPAVQAQADYNVERSEARQQGAGPAAPALGVDAHPLLRDLEAEGVALERLAGAALEKALPFAPKKEAPQAGSGAAARPATLTS